MNSTFDIYFYANPQKNEKLEYVQKLLEDYPLLTVVFAFFLGMT